MISLHPAAQQLTELLAGVTDEQLAAPTPCSQWSLDELIDHTSGFSLAFAACGRKALGAMTEQAPEPVADRLRPGWRERIAAQLTTLAEVWDDPASWNGMSQVGGVTAPAEALGGFALNEIVVHGWDVARSTGQSFSCDPGTLAYAWNFALATTGENTPFGPPFPVPESADLLDRIVGIRGRDPLWTPATT